MFVEEKMFVNGVYQLLPFDKNDDILVFVRLYDSRNESPLYIGHFLFSKKQTLRKKNLSFICSIIYFVFIEQCLNGIALRIGIPLSSSTKFNVHESIPKPNQTHQYESIKSSNFDLPLSQALRFCSSGTSMMVQIFDTNQINNDNEKCIPTFDDYFR